MFRLVPSLTRLRGALDREQGAQAWAATQPLKQAGVQLFENKPGTGVRKIHHKLMVIDERLVSVEALCVRGNAGCRPARPCGRTRTHPFLLTQPSSLLSVLMNLRMFIAIRKPCRSQPRPESFGRHTRPRERGLAGRAPAGEGADRPRTRMRHGNDAARVAGEGYDVTALDLSGEAIEPRRSRFGARVTFLLADVTQPMPFPDGTFDGVMSNVALHTFPEAVTRAVFAEIRRVVRPGGLFLFHVNTLADAPFAGASPARRAGTRGQLRPRRHRADDALLLRPLPARAARKLAGRPSRTRRDHTPGDGRPLQTGLARRRPALSVPSGIPLRAAHSTTRRFAPLQG
jgi:SAM-dependent methyltransferase